MVVEVVNQAYQGGAEVAAADLHSPFLASEVEEEGAEAHLNH